MSITKQQSDPGLRSGVYRHYKGQEYRVIGCAAHTETGEQFVVYQALYGEGRLWVRPRDMFVGTVTVEGHEFPRFTFVRSE